MYRPTMSQLVIVESPAKCGKIQGFLGFGWKVIASLGHIRHLKEDLESVGIAKDFEPTWEWMKEKSRAIQQLKDAAKEAQTIYLASDDDREGELIAYSVCLLLKLNPVTTPRAVFHEITKSAVLSAIETPRRLDMNKVNAAQARAMMDMMVGFTMSPLLWKSVGPALSAGRCQTPALRLVADREEEIKQFQTVNSWKLHGQWLVKGSNQSWEAALVDELDDQDSAENFLELCHAEPGGIVLKAETKPWTENPPVPLITSTLQQKASSLFRCGPKETMAIAQKLYEAGHITYMRTDKAVLSEEAIQQAHACVETLYGAEYIHGTSSQPKKGKSVKKSTATEGAAAKAQEAHEAIRPTHFERAELPEDEPWSVRDRKVYGLVWRMAIQSVMAQARGDQRTITFVADGENSGDFPWRATWRRTTFLGWKKAATKETVDVVSEDEQVGELSWNLAEAIKPGTRLTWTSLAADPHDTRPPQRFTEATLIRELEQKGIGRPSTFASLISTILDKKYVDIQSFEGRTVSVPTLHLTQHDQWPPEKTVVDRKVGGEKDRLTITPLGLSVLDFLLKHFDDLFLYDFTARMETRLDRIAEGQEPWKQVLQDTWDLYKDRYTDLKSQKQVTTKVPGERRREFENGVVGVLGKKGPLLLKESPDGDKDKTVFYGWPDGVGFQELTEEQVTDYIKTVSKEKEGLRLGEWEGSPIVRKQGKFGSYVEWNGKRVSCSETDTVELLIEKLQTTEKTSGKRIGSFELRKGQYGLYMFKWATTGPARKFVGVSESLNLETVKEEELQSIFQAGLAQKSRSGTTGSSRGGSSGAARGGAKAARGHWMKKRGK
jgi:DNA topoisomerase-1